MKAGEGRILSDGSEDLAEPGRVATRAEPCDDRTYEIQVLQAVDAPAQVRELLLAGQSY